MRRPGRLPSGRSAATRLEWVRQLPLAVLLLLLLLIVWQFYLGWSSVRTARTDLRLATQDVQLSQSALKAHSQVAKLLPPDGYPNQTQYLSQVSAAAQVVQALLDGVKDSAVAGRTNEITTFLSQLNTALLTASSAAAQPGTSSQSTARSNTPSSADSPTTSSSVSQSGRASDPGASASSSHSDASGSQAAGRSSAAASSGASSATPTNSTSATQSTDASGLAATPATSSSSSASRTTPTPTYLARPVKSISTALASLASGLTQNAPRRTAEASSALNTARTHLFWAALLAVAAALVATWHRLANHRGIARSNPLSSQGSIIMPMPERASPGARAITRPGVTRGPVTSSRSGLTLDVFTEDGSAILAASLVGTEHVARGTGREDSFAVAHGPVAGSVILAVADGVGSSKNSHLASAAVTEQVIEEVAGLGKDQLRAVTASGESWQKYCAHLVNRLAEDLLTRFGQGSLPAPSGSRSKGSGIPATTLSLAVSIRSADGLLVYWAAIGDSPILALEREPGAIGQIWHPPERDTVDSLPRQAAQLSTGIQRLRDSRALLLLSDGMGDVLLSVPGIAEQLLAAVLTSADPSTELLPLLSYPVRGAHDDRTIVMLAPIGGGPR